MAEHCRRSQSPSHNFGQLDKNVLQRIFMLGVQQSWPTPYEEELDESEGSLSSEEDEEEHQVFLPKRDRFRPPCELETIMDCAMVCHSWADAVLDMNFWEAAHLPLRFLRDLPEPWELGNRWNQFFADVSVVIQCSASHLLSSVGKIEVSASRGRTQFQVFFPVREKRRRNIYKAWDLLRSHLWKHCTHLTLVTRGEEGSPGFGVGDIIFRPWVHLESLKLDVLTGLSWPSVEAISRLYNTPAETLRQNPPFPALKFLSFPTHPDAHLAREVLNIAPNIERCEMDTSGYTINAAHGWDTHRNCISHRIFLKGDKRFRTYVTPFCMYAFKWPGPKTLKHLNFWWGVKSRASHSPNYGVLISETREGTICESRMSLDDLFNEDDLTQLVIPPESKD